MTDIPEDVMKAARASTVAYFNSFGAYAEADAVSNKDRDHWGEVQSAAWAIMAERERSQWQPIEGYEKEDKFVISRHILCGHSEEKWIRMGRWYPEFSKWYYSGTNERSQWAQVEGDAPTHWMPLPKPPEAS
jgi:hypothetical protein